MAARAPHGGSPVGLQDLVEVNRVFYDSLWRDARLERPERFNTWPVVTELAARAPARLEVGPGLRPRLPLEGTHFVDGSGPAVRRLRAAGAEAVLADAASLPFVGDRFALVATFDIVEHHADDHRIVREVSRVLTEDGRWLLSVPLYQSAWTEFDAFVGHYRRYEPAALEALLADHGFAIESSAVFGMQPKSAWLLRLGMWMLTRNRKRAMRWYNGCLLPLAIRFQKPLEFRPGLEMAAGVDEMVLVCRRRGSRAA